MLSHSLTVSVSMRPSAFPSLCFPSYSCLRLPLGSTSTNSFPTSPSAAGSSPVMSTLLASANKRRLIDMAECQSCVVQDFPGQRWAIPQCCFSEAVHLYEKTKMETTVALKYRTTSIPLINSSKFRLCPIPDRESSTT
jgi:hypothetical protein